MTRLVTKAALVAALMCGVSGAAFAEGKIVISNWDGYMPKELLENFKKDTGIEAEMSVHATNEEIMGKVTAGGGKGYDVLFVSSPFAEALKKLNLIADLDPAKIPNLANLYPEAQNLAYDPGNHFSVPYAWGPMPGAPPACATAATWSRRRRPVGWTC
jgi:spermidine/putrescine transport system substrate-binding protein